MALELTRITKTFGPVRANDGISLRVEPGRLHAVLGENGAGKSTLMKVLSGFQPPDDGQITLDGHPVPTGSAKAATEAGIGMLHQDPLVCLPFTVLENYALGQTRPRTELRTELVDAAATYGFDLDPDAVTRTLGVGERQQLEILRLLSLGVKVLILDEPTSGISTDQREKLFAALKRLAADGLIVLFVSHKLEEVEMLCDEVSILRGGQLVGERDLPCPHTELVGLMFDEPVLPYRPDTKATGTVVASLTGFAGHDGRTALTGIDLDVHQGEVIGLAGLDGSGQRGVLRALAGLIEPEAGTVTIGGSPAGSYDAARDRGVHYLPAGRLEEGLVPGLTIAEHLELALGSATRLDDDEMERRALAAIDHYRIKGNPSSPVDGLSGGNQQRVLLAMMPTDLTVLGMEHPTRGLDIESADFVWRALLERRDAGTAIVFSSADLDELLQYADRIAVMFEGRVLAIRTADELGGDELGYLIGGVGG